MNKRSNDLFDKIMRVRIFKPFLPFYQKWKEQLLYLLFGAMTFFLGVLLFWLFTVPLSISALSANIIDWIICVAFAYITNRTWVFKNKAHEVKGIFRECSSFVTGRIGTLLLEEFILWVGIEELRINSILVKIIAQILVIVGNYVISKWFVFRGNAQNASIDR